MVNERTPLLHAQSESALWEFGDRRDDNLHAQFCKLIGIPPSDHIGRDGDDPIPPKSLYGRAINLKKSQQTTYLFTAALSNTLLLSQVVLGAALTALGASKSSHVLITLFGAANTVIAGIVAYLKSRGQPVRARMFRDDLERIVSEIENSEMMWRGISMGMHGYDEIDIDDQVTVRSEVARLTRLYDKTVRSNLMNSPDQYQGNGIGMQGKGAGLKSRPTGLSLLGPYAQQAGSFLKPLMTDPDASPAVAPPLVKSVHDHGPENCHTHDSDQIHEHDQLREDSGPSQDGEELEARDGPDLLDADAEQFVPAESSSEELTLEKPSLSRDEKDHAPVPSLQGAEKPRHHEDKYKDAESWNSFAHSTVNGLLGKKKAKESD